MTVLRVTRGRMVYVMYARGQMLRQPNALEQAICRVWNWWACKILDHDWIRDTREGLITCMNCHKEIRFYDCFGD